MLTCLSRSWKVFHFEVGLNAPQLLLGFRRLPVGVAQLHLHLIQVRLHLLPDSHGVILAACFSIQGGLDCFHRALVVAFHLLYLLVLLGQPTINLSLDLGELKLDTENFGFLVLQ